MNALIREESNPDRDHFEVGHEFLQGIGYDLSQTWIACAGKDETGEFQVLLVGFNHLRLINKAGSIILDVSPRYVRAVRAVDGPAIEVCTTDTLQNCTLRTRWLHRVRAEEAKYIEESWLNLSSGLHEGIQLNHLSWQEEEYAYYVGRVATEAARSDVVLAGMASIAFSLLGESRPAVQGNTGKQLAEILDELGNVSPSIADISTRYLSWYFKRNFAVHGIRRVDSTGLPSSQVFKYRRAKKHASTVAEVENQDFQDLALIWRAFYALNHDAFDVTNSLLQFDPGEDQCSPEDFLRQIPIGNTVSPDERMPK